MRATVYQGESSIQWNDQGEQVTLSIHGIVLQADEKDLRDLKAVLDFLYAGAST